VKTELRLTSEITNIEWESYTNAFNEVFGKKFTKSNFKHKYHNSIDTYSYHVFLKSEDKVVGSVTVIPYEYFFDNELKRVGLAVDVFIQQNYRTDPLALFQMYKILKAQLIQREIALVIAVPNDIAYPYWKNVVKWQDIGFINYYAFAVKFGSAKRKLLYLLNPLRFIYSLLMIFLSSFIFSEEKLSRIRLNREIKVLEKQRYTKKHITHITKKYFFDYRIKKETGHNTFFIINF